MLENFRDMTADQLAREVSKVVAALGEKDCADLLRQLKQVKDRWARA